MYYLFWATWGVNYRNDVVDFNIKDISLLNDDDVSKYNVGNLNQFGYSMVYDKNGGVTIDNDFILFIIDIKCEKLDDEYIVIRNEYVRLRDSVLTNYRNEVISKLIS